MHCVSLACANADFQHGRGLLALDTNGRVPRCYQDGYEPTQGFHWDQALGSIQSFHAIVDVACSANKAHYYCYGKGNPAYKQCSDGSRIPVDQCKLEDQCVYTNYRS